MSGNKIHLLRPSSRLIAHDVRLALRELTPGLAEVVATAECERRNCTLEIDECRYCERFERIERHEAGYMMLCRSQDEDPDTND